MAHEYTLWDAPRALVDQMMPNPADRYRFARRKISGLAASRRDKCAKRCYLVTYGATLKCL